jgi:hypothetical protein
MVGVTLLTFCHWHTIVADGGYRQCLIENVTDRLLFVNKSGFPLPELQHQSASVCGCCLFPTLAINQMSPLLMIVLLVVASSGTIDFYDTGGLESHKYRPATRFSPLSGRHSLLVR